MTQGVSYYLGRAVDMFAAVALLVVLNGLSVGTSDDTAFLPWIFKASDPALYAGDPRFGSWPISYYWFHLFYLRAVSAIVPIPMGLVLSVLLSWALLLFALRQLSEVLTGRPAPALLFAALMTGYFNNHLVGHYYLFARGFSTHFLAFPLVLLAVAWLLRGRNWSAWALLIPAIAINPRVGVFGVASLAIVWISLQQGPVRMRFAWAAGSFALVVTALFVATVPHTVVGMPFEQILNAWVFIRSPGHYAPLAWPRFVLVVLGLVVMSFVLLWRFCPERKVRALWTCGVVGLVFILGGIINSIWMIVPSLVLANPFEFGLTVLSVLYVLIVIVLFRRMGRGRIFSTLPILIVPDLQTRLLLLIVTLIADHYTLPPQEQERPVLRMQPAEGRLLAVQAAIFLVSSFFISDDWRQLVYATQFLSLPLTVLATLLALSWRVPPVRRFSGVLGVAFLGLMLGMQLLRANPNPVRSPVTNDTLDLCRFIVAHTDKRAVFITPPDKDDFQYECRRASFFNFTHLPLALNAVPEWIARMRLLKVISPDADLATLDRALSPDFAAYEKMDAEMFRALYGRDNRVAYVVVPSSQSLRLPLVYENLGYRLYALGPQQSGYLRRQ